MKLVDTHCHLTCDKLFEKRLDIIKRANDAGIEDFLVICTSFEEFQRAKILQREVSGIKIAYGIYPCDSAMWNEFEKKRLVELAKNKEIDAVGEIGLDYHYEGYDKDQQHLCFREQIQIASEYNLPILIHMRDATKDCLNILTETPLIEGIMHCFSGSIETAKKILKSRLYISFAGVITFKNAVSIIEVVKTVPLNRMMIETDCPYLTPHPFRGKENEPMYLAHTFNKVIEIKQCSEEELSNSLWENYQKLINKT